MASEASEAAASSSSVGVWCWIVLVVKMYGPCQMLETSFVSSAMSSGLVDCVKGSLTLRFPLIRCRFPDSSEGGVWSKAYHPFAPLL